MQSTAGQGFAGIVVEPQSRRLVLYWHGAVPGKVEAATRRAKNTGGYPVVVRAARYTKAHLDRLRNSIAAHDTGYGISVVVVLPSGAGLQIGLRGFAARAKRLPEIATTSVPIHYFKANIVPLGRWVDKPRFSGGAWIGNPKTDIICTSGFPAHFKKKTYVNFMVTAAHCIHLPVREDQWYAGAGDDRLGDALGEDWSATTTNDAASIHLGTGFGTPGGGGGNQIYVGGVDKSGGGSGERKVTVVGAGHNNTGDYVEVSGSYSGQVGNNKIVSTDAVWQFSEMGTNFRVAGSEAEQVNHLGAVGEGDSGGPVYAPGSRGVWGRGLVSAGNRNDTGKCQGVQTQPCMWQWFYPNMLAILPELNMALNTGS